MGPTGTQSCGNDSLPAAQTDTYTPFAICLDRAPGHLYVAEAGCNRLRRIDLNGGSVTTVAGVTVSFISRRLYCGVSGGWWVTPNCFFAWVFWSCALSGKP